MRVGDRGSGRGKLHERNTRLVALAASVVLGGCDLLNPQAPAPGEVFDAPLPGLTAAELSAFVSGDEAFGRRFSPNDGLGPIFNDVSCASCHSADGRGRVENALVRFSIGDDLVPHLGGPQLQTRAIAGALPESVPDGVSVSVRLPPPVFGVGLIEAIPEATIVALADPDDEDGDGISGRPNYVVPRDFIPVDEVGGYIFEEGVGALPQLGRFSHKAQVSSLLLQVVEAYHQDIGITTDFLPIENRNRQASRGTEAADRVSDPELPEAEVRAVLAYLRTLAPPAPGEMTPRRAEGERLFEEIGCAACHVPVLHSGPSSIEALANRPVPLFSDLLLHDMGEALADHRPDGDATGREWRTTPLWGLRLIRQFLNGEAFLLHDGRAASVEEAILLHGGEAAGAQERFTVLTGEERAAILDFVRVPLMVLDRRTFLERGIAILAAAGLPGCASVAVTRLTPVGGSLQLTLREFPQLAQAGGFAKVQSTGASTPLYVLALGEDRFAALSPICTHLGCTVDLEGAALVCPCHGSTYDLEGRVLRGPAERALSSFPASLTEPGVLTIDLEGGR